METKPWRSGLLIDDAGRKLGISPGKHMVASHRFHFKAVFEVNCVPKKGISYIFLLYGFLRESPSWVQRKACKIIDEKEPYGGFFLVSLKAVLREGASCKKAKSNVFLSTHK